MSWKTLFITNPCKISIDKSNLLITINGEKNSICITDIASLIIETNQVTLTTAAISKLAKNGVVILSIDDYFMPSSITLPFHSHSLYSKIVHAQVGMSEPLKKRLWQKIIISKIVNQAHILSIFDNPIKQKRLLKLSKEVLSGDSTNCEAQASRIYWSSLFNNFSREGEGAIDIRNSALNYGYAIIRSAVARSMVGVGLMPSFGVFHRNYFNAFNFVDDLIEPYRPFVDMHVKILIADMNENEFLTTELKARLIDLINIECVEIANGLSSLRTAIDTTLKSVQKVILQKEIEHLVLPSLNFEKYMKNCYECV